MRFYGVLLDPPTRESRIVVLPLEINIKMVRARTHLTRSPSQSPISLILSKLKSSQLEWFLSVVKVMKLCLGWKWWGSVVGCRGFG